MSLRRSSWVLLILLALPSLASDKKKLKDALAAVDANLKTPSGKRYDEAMSKEFPEKHVDGIRQCKQSVGGKAPAPFDMFLKLDNAGKVNQVLVYPETRMALCSGDALLGETFSPPPHADYWLNIHMEFRK